MQGRFQRSDNRFGSPNSTLRPRHMGHDFHGAPMHGFGNRTTQREHQRFPQDHTRIFNPPDSPFMNRVPGSHPQHIQHNPQFNPNTHVNPHVPPPPITDNLQSQKEFPFQHPGPHTQQHDPGSQTRNISLQNPGMSQVYPRNEARDFPKMQESHIGNSKWMQSDKKFHFQEQQSNANVSFPPSGYSVSTLGDCRQFPPPSYIGDGIKNQMVFDSPKSEHHMQFTQEIREQPKLERTKETSQQWVNRWLGQIGKSSSGQLTQLSSEPASGKTLKICEAQERVKQMFFLLAKLKQETAYLESLTYDSDEWKAHTEITTQLQIELRQHKDVMTDEAMLSDLQQRIAKRRKKRLRQKEVRRERYDDRQTQMAERDKLHKMVDDWQARIQKEELNKSQEKELKATADSILSEVRKKITDAVKTIDLLKGLQKLRKLRKDRLSRQGITVPIGNDIIFEEQVTQQLKMMQSQKEVYLAEEKTLKVMLEVEQEETQV
ncbi:programmed cell death protein 7-like isoform X2 [Ylistrum balloti]|uniref:programmed cell death protein 7-like isoform X2 n=1 Tax=Ylistrum balloti TaxID=509963 RepID=UPI002905EADB|nr:programmed cell death protein 7-like isoform X2 [Ylistrum balloti]